MKSPFRSEFVRKFFVFHWILIWLGQAIVFVAVGFVIAWNLNDRPIDETGKIATIDQSQHADEPSDWTCSMHPQIRRDSPGKCPICGMELIPVKATSGGMRRISISPTAQSLMQIETSPVERKYVTAEIRMVGKVEYDETKLAHITAWVSGRLDRLYVDYAGIEVKKGDHLVYIYSEELYSAQEELIQAIKHRRDRPAISSTLITPIDLVASAREKLRLLGLTQKQIQTIEERGSPSDHVTIYAPAEGIVVEKMRQEGDRVRTGDRIYTVADLRQVWVKLDAYESDLQWLRYGQDVEFTTEAYPGEIFRGRIAFIDPILNKETRTVKVRVNVPNDDGRLKPEMFVRAVLRSRVAVGGRVLDSELTGKWISPMHPEIVKDEPGNCDICGMPLVRAESLGYTTAEPSDDARPLVIPASAALVTGTRAIVYVQIPNTEKPTFEGREIVLGPRAGSYYLVRNGLKEGDLVVTNGNFKLDSALQIAAKPSMMTPEGGRTAGHDHGGHGGNAKSSGEATSGHQVTLPLSLKTQFEQLLTAHDAVTVAIENADLAHIRDAFTELESAIENVDATNLAGHSAMQWHEFSMLLGNDAAEGGIVKSLQDADRVHLELSRHIQRVRETFGLVNRSHEVHPARLEVPASFQSQLVGLWNAYLPISQALARDDFASTKRTISKLNLALAEIESSMLAGDAARVWEKENANLEQIVSRLGEAEDLAKSRSAFALLSDELVALVRTFGLGQTENIFELHCRMAFEGRGASWLQNDAQPRNPYFGASMLKCADRVEPISPTNRQPSSETNHSAHEH